MVIVMFFGFLVQQLAGHGWGLVPRRGRDGTSCCQDWDSAEAEEEYQERLRGLLGDELRELRSWGSMGIHIHYGVGSKEGKSFPTKWQISSLWQFYGYLGNLGVWTIFEHTLFCHTHSQKKHQNRIKHIKRIERCRSKEVQMRNSRFTDRWL